MVWADLEVKNLLFHPPIHSFLVLISTKAVHKEDESLSQAIVQVNEEERNFIATELHDNASQMITATKLLVDAVIHKGNKEELLQLCSTNLKMVIEEVRRLSYSL